MAPIKAYRVSDLDQANNFLQNHRVEAWLVTNEEWRNIKMDRRSLSAVTMKSGFNFMYNIPVYVRY